MHTICCAGSLTGSILRGSFQSTFLLYMLSVLISCCYTASLQMSEANPQLPSGTWLFRSCFPCVRRSQGSTQSLSGARRLPSCCHYDDDALRIERCFTIGARRGSCGHGLSAFWPERQCRSALLGLSVGTREIGADFDDHLPFYDGLYRSERSDLAFFF